MSKLSVFSWGVGLLPIPELRDWAIQEQRDVREIPQMPEVRRVGVVLLFRKLPFLLPQATLGADAAGVR